MAHYLVPGAAGFIAARTIEMLLAAGHSVLGVDNMNDSYDVRMKEYRLKKLRALDGFAFKKLDIAKREDVLNLKSEGSYFDGVINLAARAGVRASVEDPWAYMDTNANGTLNLLELCRQQEIPKFVLASTSSIYGENTPLPTPETAESDMPLQPYAASKKAAEAMSHAYHYLYEIDVTVVRYFTVYGPAGRPDMSMFRFTQWISEELPLQLNGDGEQTRGFTYVDDIARGTMLALNPVGYEIVNLGGHESITMNALIVMLEERIGKKARVEHKPFPRADMLASWADVSKAGEMLGWEPQVPLAEGLKNLVDWYNTEREWASRIETQ